MSTERKPKLTDKTIEGLRKLLATLPISSVTSDSEPGVAYLRKLVIWHDQEVVQDKRLKKREYNSTRAA